jgi:hypothetical protein
MFILFFLYVILKFSQLLKQSFLEFLPFLLFVTLSLIKIQFEITFQSSSLSKKTIYSRTSLIRHYFKPETCYPDKISLFMIFL